MACVECGAPLPPGEGLPEVTCTYCGHRGEHPEPLVPGTEVLLRSGLAYQLARVRVCQGPNAIDIAFEDGKSRTVPLASLVAVTSEGLRSNMRVYARKLLGWELTWAEKVTASTVEVKHSSEGFQSDYFNDTIARADVRIPLRRELREQRTFLQQLWLEKRGAVVGCLGLIAILALWVLWARC